MDSNQFVVNTSVFFVSVQRIKEEEDTIFLKLATARLNDNQECLLKVGQGTVDYDYPMKRELIIESTTNAAREILATHYCGKHSLLMMWKEDVIQRNYLNANRAAATRGVRIERMFVINTSLIEPSTELTPLIEILDEHEAQGLAVKILFEEDLAHGWGDDMVIIDERRIHIYNRGQSHLFEKVTLSIDKALIHRYHQLYENFSLRAVGWPLGREVLESRSRSA